ncbi:MAG: 2-C-methyl-D-erythritol 4-phosphate cytidylyltransferase [Chloroflexota bacterium]
MTLEASEPVGAILVAAGRSERMGFDKIWTELGGRPLLAWSLGTLTAIALLRRIAVVVSPERVSEARDLVPASRGRIAVVAGGSRRRDSVRHGLETLADVTWVVVHDAARPFVQASVLAEGVAAAARTGAAVAALPCTDTVKRARDGNVVETLDRSELWMVQTPQVFRRDLLIDALDSTDEDVTDEAALLERMGVTVRVFPGDPRAFKVTSPADLDRARSMLAWVSSSA